MDREAAINDGGGYDEIYRMSHAQLPQVRHSQYKKICSSRLLLPVAVNVVVPSSEATGSSFRCFYFDPDAAGNKQVEPAPSAQRWLRFKTVMAQDRCYFRHRTFVLPVSVHALTLAGLEANVKQFLRLDKTLTEVHTPDWMNGLTGSGHPWSRQPGWLLFQRNKEYGPANRNEHEQRKTDRSLV